MPKCETPMFYKAFCAFGSEQKSIAQTLCFIRLLEWFSWRLGQKWCPDPLFYKTFRIAKSSQCRSSKSLCFIWLFALLAVSKKSIAQILCSIRLSDRFSDFGDKKWCPDPLFYKAFRTGNCIKWGSAKSLCFIRLFALLARSKKSSRRPFVL